MATVTITSSENIIFEDAGGTPITVTIGSPIYITAEVRIDGFIVDQGNTPSAGIAVGDTIRGILNDKYIVALVESLPYSLESNLKFYLQTQ